LSFFFFFFFGKICMSIGGYDTENRFRESCAKILEHFYTFI
jgi:hypothetical protein